MVTRDTSDGRDHYGLIYKLWERLLSPDGIIRYGLNSPEDWKSLDAKFNGLCCLPDDGKAHLMRRIDIFGVPRYISFHYLLSSTRILLIIFIERRDELPAALIAFTGNDVRTYYSELSLIIMLTISFIYLVLQSFDEIKSSSYGI